MRLTIILAFCAMASGVLAADDSHLIVKSPGGKIVEAKSVTITNGSAKIVGTDGMVVTLPVSTVQSIESKATPPPDPHPEQIAALQERVKTAPARGRPAN